MELHGVCNRNNLHRSRERERDGDIDRQRSQIGFEGFWGIRTPYPYNNIILSRDTTNSSHIE